MDLPTHESIKPRRGLRLVLASLVALALVIGGLSLSTSTAATPLSITSIWKAIKKKTDRRYYTKAATRALVYTRAESDARFYTRSSSDARYYTRSSSDARYPAKPSLVRGTWGWSVSDAGNQRYGIDNISFGLTMPTAPTAHYIAVGQTPPEGCSGTAEEPVADPGHLCVFEGTASFVAIAGVSSVSNQSGASRFGAVVYGYGVITKQAWAAGSWVLGTVPDAQWGP